MTSPVLPGFDYHRVDAARNTLACAVAGPGPPLLLLHGCAARAAPDRDYVDPTEA